MAGPIAVAPRFGPVLAVPSAAPMSPLNSEMGLRFDPVGGISGMPIPVRVGHAIVRVMSSAWSVVNLGSVMLTLIGMSTPSAPLFGLVTDGGPTSDGSGLNCSESPPRVLDWSTIWSSGAWIPKSS